MVLTALRQALGDTNTQPYFRRLENYSTSNSQRHKTPCLEAFDL